MYDGKIMEYYIDWEDTKIEKGQESDWEGYFMEQVTKITNKLLTSLGDLAQVS